MSSSLGARIHASLRKRERWDFGLNLINIDYRNFEKAVNTHLAYHDALAKNLGRPFHAFSATSKRATAQATSTDEETHTSGNATRRCDTVPSRKDSPMVSTAAATSIRPAASQMTQPSAGGMFMSNER